MHTSTSRLPAHAFARDSTDPFFAPVTPLTKVHTTALLCLLLCLTYRVQGKAKYLSMVAGGSGVTPCFDVAREVLHNPTDNTRVSLVYANKHEEDIWLRKVCWLRLLIHPLA